MNVKLLKQIKQEILKEPTRFNIYDWIETGSDYSNCGTTACIAGWAVTKDFANQHPDKPWNAICKLAKRSVCSVDVAARKLLEIDEDQADRLFYSDSWPEPFQSEQDELMTQFHSTNDCHERTAIRVKMAKVAARRIDEFIETEGEE